MHLLWETPVCTVGSRILRCAPASLGDAAFPVDRLARSPRAGCPHAPDRTGPTYDPARAAPRRIGHGPTKAASRLSTLVRTITGLAFVSFAGSPAPAIGEPNTKADASVRAILRLRAYGDSITAGFGLPPGEAWACDVARRTGVPIDATRDLRAVLGGSVMDWGELAYRDDVRDGDAALILPGYNDVRGNGADPAERDAYGRALAAYLAWLAIPDAGKVPASAARYEGGWRPAPGPYGRVTDGRGFVRVRVSGTAVFLGLWTHPSGGHYTVLVDGRRIAGTTRGAMGNAGYASRQRFGASLVTIGHLRPGAHNVVVRTAGDGMVAFAWAGGNAGMTRNHPRVWVGEPLRVAPAGIGTPGPGYGNYTDAARSAYARVTQSVVRSLAANGLAVRNVALADRYDPTAGMLQPDNIHPNLIGRTIIADAFVEAIRR